MAMVLMRGMCVQSKWLLCWGYLSIFVTMAMVLMGDMCVQSITAIHTTISNLRAAIFETAIYSLRLFVVGGDMAVGNICIQNIMVVHHTIIG